MTVINSGKQPPYTLSLLVSCEPPYSAVGNDWYQYKISQGPNIITGYKCGEYQHVLQSIEINIERLNLRQKGKFGAIHTSTSTKS